MKSILAAYTASITELKKNPSALLEQADGSPIAILNHNTPTAYLLSASTYEALLENIGDDKINKMHHRLKSKATPL